MQIVYGINPVSELLNSEKRKCFCVYVAKNKKNSDLKKIEQVAKKKSVRIVFADTEEIGQKAKTKEHQGVMAETEEYPYVPVRSLKSNLIIVADGIQDPHNLGAIIRSSLLLGVTDLVIPEKGSAKVTAAVAKASAGSVEYMDISRVLSLSEFINERKSQGYKVYALEAGSSEEIDKVKFHSSAIIVIGGEGHGVRNSIIRKCDQVISIPIRSNFVGSYNASVAAALAIYEATKK